MNRKPNTQQALPDDYFSRERDDIYSLVADLPPARILDVGCGEGHLGKRLRESGHVVIGIEKDEAAVIAARKNLDDVYHCDAEKMDLRLDPEPFDLVILGDILEHLVDPWNLLYNLHSALNHHGKIIASIPNIQYFPIILNLIRGRFEYCSHGILDRTHLRFFTPREARSMFLSMNYEVVQSPTIYPYKKKWLRVLAGALSTVSLGILKPFLIGNIFIVAVRTPYSKNRS